MRMMSLREYPNSVFFCRQQRVGLSEVYEAPCLAATYPLVLSLLPFSGRSGDIQAATFHETCDMPHLYGLVIACCCPDAGRAMPGMLRTACKA
jgi:hypothetical protein